MVLAVQLFPNARKKRLLTAKLHLGPLLVVRAAQLFQILLGVGGTLAAAHHVVVQDVERFGCVGQRLDAGGKESPGTVPSETMAARETGETGWKTLAFTKAVRFGKDTRLHLTEQVVRKGRGVWLVFVSDQGCRVRQFAFHHLTVAVVDTIVFEAIVFETVTTTVLQGISHATSTHAATSTIWRQVVLVLARQFRHGIAPGGKELVRVATCRTESRRFLLSCETGKRWRSECRMSNAIGCVNKSQTERALDPVSLGGATAGVIGLEGLVAAHNVVWYGGTVVQVSLQ